MIDISPHRIDGLLTNRDARTAFLQIFALAEPPPSDHCMIERVARRVANWTGVTIREIRGKGRPHEVAAARHLVCYLARELGIASNGVRRYLHYRDYHSPANACRAVQNLCDTEPRYALLVSRILSVLRSRINSTQLHHD